jgi:hypothetical protein
MSFSGRAKGLLRRLAGEPAKAASRPRKAAAEPVAKRSVTDEAAEAHSLKTRLAALVQGRSAIAAGSFHLVGLAEIRERLGANWDRVRDKVHQETRRIIERRIGAKDVYFAGSADDYVLVFAVLGKSAAQLVCAKISQEVQRSMLGDSETQDISVRTLVCEIDGNFRIEKTKLSDLVAAAVVAAATGSASAELVWADMPAPPTFGPGAPALPKHAQSGIVYRPVWDVRREAVSTYLTRRGPTVGAGPDELSRLEHEALQAGIEMLADLYQNQFRLRLSFPVSFEAIASVSRLRTYLALCRTIPEHLRKLVAFELVNLPIGVPNGRLTELAVALRPYCGLILATVDWRHADLSQFTKTGIRLVNAVISPGSNEKQNMAEMDRFAIAAEKAELQSAIEGVGTSSLALAAKAAGVNFISGDRIGPCVEAPHGMLRISWNDVYFGKQPAA